MEKRMTRNGYYQSIPQKLGMKDGFPILTTKNVLERNCGKIILYGKPIQKLSEKGIRIWDKNH